jgi:alcohol dehydrogenase
VLPEIVRQSKVRVVYGCGSLARLGACVVDEGGTRVLLVTDRGLVRAGHVGRALASLRDAGVEATVFDGVQENPTTRHVEAAVAAAREMSIDLIVGLGGGSSMDCAKGANFLVTNGGRMQDYWGVGKATQPMIPLVAVPTTSGTGSEAQSFALVTDPDTHQKMACGDEKALPRAAILDPDLTATVPPAVASATGIDAVAHAVETAGCTKRTYVSRQLSREAWALLERGLEPYLADHSDAQAREVMMLGSHLAGIAIEKSMLGAAHACANPLTARFGTPHGVAVGLMLPHVVRFNAGKGENPYADLMPDAEALATRIERMLAAAKLPRRLSELNVRLTDLPELAASAASQWTASFNPRPVGAAELQSLYEAALHG